MDVQTITSIIFSPTGATRKTVGSIVEGTGIAHNVTIDLTSRNVRDSTPPPVEGDLIVIGVPVYAKGLPALLIPVLKSLDGRNKPAVLVAVYGNMSEGVALHQLRLIAEASGFCVVGAGAFIGEHTFSTTESPVAPGRPDPEDLRKAHEFGERVIEKVRKLKDLSTDTPTLPASSKPQLYIRMSLPIHTAWVYARTPRINRNLCTQCKLCARHCPTSAIDATTIKINAHRCLRCCSCVKRCPQHAMKTSFRMGLPGSRLLSALSKKRKEPQTYL
ncbi:MAG TPA: EFR1 family ferrodoxin [Methanocella sp.]|nr:EFR1 family ferrodoxin [Methanocella sp.]